MARHAFALPPVQAPRAGGGSGRDRRPDADLLHGQGHRYRRHRRPHGAPAGRGSAGRGSETGRRHRPPGRRRAGRHAVCRHRRPGGGRGRGAGIRPRLRGCRACAGDGGGLDAHDVLERQADAPGFGRGGDQAALRAGHGGRGYGGLQCAEHALAAADLVGQAALVGRQVDGLAVEPLPRSLILLFGVCHLSYPASIAGAPAFPAGPPARDAPGPAPSPADIQTYRPAL